MTLAHPLVLSQQELYRLADEAGVEFVAGQIVAKPVSIESSRIGARIIRLLGEDEITGESALPGFRCRVSKFFARSA